jgi:hyperosmotically inducible periplasmic protein
MLAQRYLRFSAISHVNIQTGIWKHPCTTQSMKRTHLSNLAVTCQLFAISAGLVIAAPVQSSGASGQVAADQQKSGKSDRELTQDIRKAVMADKSLSLEAHNVKIISRNGLVTLRGAVKSQDEKNAVVDKAIQVAGAGNVTDELTVSSR